MEAALRRRRAVIASIAIIGCTGFLGAPATASAHTLSKQRATSQIRYVAKQVAAGMPDVVDWEAGACVRLTRHAFRCTYFLFYVDETRCGQRLKIFYRNHSSRRLSQKAVTDLECGF